MTDKLDIDNLARECGASTFSESSDYVFSPEELIAYTRAVMEECAKVCDNIALENMNQYDIEGAVNIGMCAAIRRMMP